MIENENNNTKQGAYIVFEGIDGAGKTTQIQAIHDKLQETYNIQTNIIRETEIQETEKDDKYTMTLKYALQRIPINKYIQENKESIILSDRSYLSSMAYQGITEQDRTWIRTINEAIIPKPDIIIYLDKQPLRRDYTTIEETWKYTRIWNRYKKIIPIDAITVETRYNSIKTVRDLIISLLLPRLNSSAKGIVEGNPLQ